MNTKLQKAERKVIAWRSTFRKNMLLCILCAVFMVIDGVPVSLRYDSPLTPMTLTFMIMSVLAFAAAVFFCVLTIMSGEKMRKAIRKRNWLREVEALEVRFRQS